MQWIPSGQPLNTFEKHAPMCTLGVGGRPLLVSFGDGGVLFFRSLFRGGRDGAEGSVSDEATVEVPAVVDSSGGKTPERIKKHMEVTGSQTTFYELPFARNHSSASAAPSNVRVAVLSSRSCVASSFVDDIGKVALFKQNNVICHHNKHYSS